jgi:hypothetical protein
VSETYSGFIVVKKDRGEGGWDVPSQRLSTDRGPAEGLREQGNYRAGVAGRGSCYRIAFVTVEAPVPSAGQIREWLAARGWRELPALASPGLTVWQADGGGLIRLPDGSDAASIMASVESIAAAAFMSPAELAREMTEIPAQL